MNIANIYSATKAECAAILGLTARSLRGNYKEYIVYADANNTKIDIPQTVANVRAADGNSGPSEEQIDAKTRIERAKAEIEELKLAKIKGDIVRTSDAERAITEIILSFRAGCDRLETSLPTSLNKKNPSNIRSVLEKSFESLFNDLHRISDGLQSNTRESSTTECTTGDPENSETNQ